MKTKMRQRPLFDDQLGKKARESGIDKAERHRQAEVAAARRVAREIAEAKANRTCTADEVQAVLEHMKIDLGNAAGALFRGKDWKIVGYTASRRVSRHRNMIRIWKLVG